MKRYQAYIDGEWRDPAGGEWFETINPFLARPWAEIPRCGAADAEAAVAAAGRAFAEGGWGTLPPAERGATLRRLADVFSRHAGALAEAEICDNGKCVSEVRPQLRGLERYYRYFAGLADKVEGALIPNDVPDVLNYSTYEPLGVVAAITPWNSPLMIAAWKIAPALAAGNTIVLKPSELASASTLEMMELFEDAGVPPGVVNVVTGFGKEVGEPLVAHEEVAKVSFTGSVEGGRRVNEVAAKHFKRVTLELGGKGAQLVFADAEIDNAVHGVASGIFLSNGQTCVAGSRVVVHESIHDEFVERIARLASRVRMGDPLDPGTEVGPIANQAQYEKILAYISIAEREGARCVAGGRPASRPECGDGWFVEPTVFTGVDNGMRIAREEVFGPVLSVMRFRDEEEAVGIANDTPYGLANGVWTTDMRRAIRVARRLESGTVYVNNYRSVSTTSPVGGYKASGLGRENGAEAIKEFMQVKSVWLGLMERIDSPFGS